MLKDIKLMKRKWKLDVFANMGHTHEKKNWGSNQACLPP